MVLTQAAIIASGGRSRENSVSTPVASSTSGGTIYQDSSTGQQEVRNIPPDVAIRQGPIASGSGRRRRNVESTPVASSVTGGTIYQDSEGTQTVVAIPPSVSVRTLPPIRRITNNSTATEQALNASLPENLRNADPIEVKRQLNVPLTRRENIRANYREFKRSASTITLSTPAQAAVSGAQKVGEFVANAGRRPDYRSQAVSLPGDTIVKVKETRFFARGTSSYTSDKGYFLEPKAPTNQEIISRRFDVRRDILGPGAQAGSLGAFATVTSPSFAYTGFKEIKDAYSLKPTDVSESEESKVNRYRSYVRGGLSIGVLAVPAVIRGYSYATTPQYTIIKSAAPKINSVRFIGESSNVYGFNARDIDVLTTIKYPQQRALVSTPLSRILFRPDEIVLKEAKTQTIRTSGYIGKTNSGKSVELGISATPLNEAGNRFKIDLLVGKGNQQDISPQLIKAIKSSQGLPDNAPIALTKGLSDSLSGIRSGESLAMPVGNINLAPKPNQLYFRELKPNVVRAVGLGSKEVTREAFVTLERQGGTIQGSLSKEANYGVVFSKVGKSPKASRAGQVYRTDTITVPRAVRSSEDSVIQIDIPKSKSAGKALLTQTERESLNNLDAALTASLKSSKVTIPKNGIIKAPLVIPEQTSLETTSIAPTAAKSIVRKLYVSQTQESPQLLTGPLARSTLSTSNQQVSSAFLGQSDKTTQSFLQSTKVAEILKTKQGSGNANRLRERVRQEVAQDLKIESRQVQEVASALQLKSKSSQVFQNINKVQIKIPKPIEPFRVPKTNRGSSRLTSKTTQSSFTTQAYDVISFTKGKPFTIARGLPEGRANKAGADFITKNLRASFKLQASGTTRTSDINYRINPTVFRKGKRDAQRIVQRSKFRLSSGTERSEIRSSRRKKARRSFF